MWGSTISAERNRRFFNIIGICSLAPRRCGAVAATVSKMDTQRRTEEGKKKERRKNEEGKRKERDRNEERKEGEVRKERGRKEQEVRQSL